MIGPAGLGLLRLSEFGDPFTIFEQFARFTVGLAVMAAALRLPRRYVQEHARSIAAVLVPGMVGMWLVGGLLAYALLGVPFWVTMLVGAIVKPTDLVLAGTIVTGTAAEQNIPEPIRTSSSLRLGPTTGSRTSSSSSRSCCSSTPPVERWSTGCSGRSSGASGSPRS